jgi:hypothetical protein
MGFYKSFLIGNIVTLIIILSILGVILSNTIAKQNFPAEYNPCPDYYTIDTNGNCLINNTIYSSSDISCTNKKFTDNNYLVGGTGPLSGLCAKKTWANNCGVTWDGITNNSDICNIK